MTSCSTFLADLRKRRDALFNPEAFPNVAAVQLKWAEIEKEQAEFVNRVTDEALSQMVSLDVHLSTSDCPVNFRSKDGYCICGIVDNRSPRSIISPVENLLSCGTSPQCP